MDKILTLALSLLAMLVFQSGSTIDQIVEMVSPPIFVQLQRVSFHVTNFGGSLGVTVDALNINSIPVPASITTGIMNVDGVSGGTFARILM